MPAFGLVIKINKELFLILIFFRKTQMFIMPGTKCDSRFLWTFLEKWQNIAEKQTWLNLKKKW